MTPPKFDGLFTVYRAAMVDADIDGQNGLLDACYFLGHITVSKQPKAEWLDVIRKGQFDYHKIDIEQGPTIGVTGTNAVRGGVSSAPHQRDAQSVEAAIQYFVGEEPEMDGNSPPRFQTIETSVRWPV